MELRELGDRLLGLYAKLIAAMILVGVLGALAIHANDEHQYQAKVRFVLGAQDPQNPSTAAALADTARGIATGPQLVAEAISDSGAVRDKAKVAAAIDVSRIGSSGVLTLTVTDRDPKVAVRLANAVAAGVVDTRIALIQNGIASAIRDLDQQAAATDKQIRKLNARIEKLGAEIAVSPATSGQNPLNAQLDQLTARRTSLQAQATQLAVQRNALTTEQAQRPETTVIDKAVSAASVHGRRLLDVLLGGLLGLVAGIAIAAVRETVRPSLVGAGAISRAVGAPLLGEINGPPDRWTMASLPDAGTYVELAADNNHVQDVRFAALDPGGRHGAQVRMLEGPLHRVRFRASSAAAGDSSSPPTGLVVAMPRVLRLADVDALTNFTWISGWTLLGVIVYRPTRNRNRAQNVRLGLGRSRPRRDRSPDGQVEVDA